MDKTNYNGYCKQVQENLYKHKEKIIYFFKVEFLIYKECI